MKKGGGPRSLFILNSARISTGLTGNEKDSRDLISRSTMLQEGEYVVRPSHLINLREAEDRSMHDFWQEQTGKAPFLLFGTTIETTRQ